MVELETAKRPFERERVERSGTLRNLTRYRKTQVAGTTDPAVLAELAKGRLRAKLPALREALSQVV